MSPTIPRRDQRGLALLLAIVAGLAALAMLTACAPAATAPLIPPDCPAGQMADTTFTDPYGPRQVRAYTIRCVEAS